MNTFSPVCVLRCLRRSDGLSNALPQYSHGSIVRSRAFFTITGVTDDLVIGSGEPSVL